MTPTIGRTVIYKLSESDADLISHHRADFDGRFGNPVSGGQEFPAVVVAAWPGSAAVNLKVQLDGNDHYWATSRLEGDQPGMWSWPQRAELDPAALTTNYSRAHEATGSGHAFTSNEGGTSQQIGVTTVT